MPQRPAAQATSVELSTIADLASAPVLLAILTIVAAGAVLLVVGLDLRRLRRSARLTAAHGIVGGVFAATVITLAVMFTAGLAQHPAANANIEAPTPATGIASHDPLSGVQLPTLSDD